MAGKIILFVVEGASDETVLGPYLTREFKKKRLTLTIRIMGGDIMTAWINEYTRDEFEITPSNIKLKLTKLIKTYLESSEATSIGIKARDIGKIYYVTDTDNCFNLTNAEKINKSKCLKVMFNTRQVKISTQKTVPMEVIFFAENLEHITKNQLQQFTDEEKENFAEDFSHRSLIEPGFFENFFRDQSIKQWDNYRDSYEGILIFGGRACNMNNLLDEIENGIEL